MSKLALIRDPKFQLHLQPPFHPESPQRLAAIDQAFARSTLDNSVEQLEPRLAAPDEIALVHSPAYIEDLERDSQLMSKGKLIQLDSDTYMSAQSFDTAKLAAGAGLVAIDRLSNSDLDSAFVAVRPPGHHALRDRAMGFCLFNNIAVAARYAQKHQGFKRVCIIDWDVHHGNGTQDMFYSDPSVCYISMHQYPFFYPGTGAYTEDGRGEGKGYNINIPLLAGSGDRGHLAAWDKIIRPIGLAYQPDLILVSAGYDAHRNDPVGGQNVSTSGFAMLSQRLLDLATMTGAKTVCILEGGYNVQALADSVIATMRVLNSDTARSNAEVHVSYLVPGSAAGEDPITNDEAPSTVDQIIEDVRKHFSKYWPSLSKI